MRRWRSRHYRCRRAGRTQVSIAEKAAEGKVTVTAAVAAPLGTSTLVLQAKGKVGGQNA